MRAQQILLGHMELPKEKGGDTVEPDTLSYSLVIHAWLRACCRNNNGSGNGRGNDWGDSGKNNNMGSGGGGCNGAPTSRGKPRR